MQFKNSYRRSFPRYLYWIKRLCLISVYLAGIIILLHSLIPHEHHHGHDTVVIDHISDHDFDWLAILHGLFETDLGENHLQHFTKASGMLFSVQFVYTCATPLKWNQPYFNRTEAEFRTSIITYPTIEYFDPGLISDPVWRGPPIYLS